MWGRLLLNLIEYECYININFAIVNKRIDSFYCWVKVYLHIAIQLSSLVFEIRRGVKL